jgi:peroxiredoxin
MSLLHSHPLSPGWPAPDFKLKNAADDRESSLSDFTDKPGLLVFFTCNHCPYARAAWPLIIDLFQKFKHQVAFVAINPNDPVAYPDDSYEQMKLKVNQWPIPFPYLHDSTQQVARDYQAQCTPDLYLFKSQDSRFTLFYHGRVNDNWQNPGQVREENLRDALQRLVSHQPPPQDQPPSMGCSIKWKHDQP